jgi:hypothetical protein
MSCQRCGGTGFVHWTTSMSGGIGPCPRCRPIGMVKDFISQINPFNRGERNA